jgi:hypothetical protein
MSLRVELQEWILESLRGRGGSARIVEIAEDVWTNHEAEIRKYRTGLYTWQYDMRWSSQYLTDNNLISKDRGVWSIV